MGSSVKEFPKVAQTGQASDLVGNPFAGYVSYQAFVSQSSTSAPSATQMANSFGTTMTWARTSAGLYTCTAGAAVFTVNKTAIILSAKNDEAATSILATRTSSTVITVGTIGIYNGVVRDFPVEYLDDILDNILFEIRTYA